VDITGNSFFIDSLSPLIKEVFQNCEITNKFKEEIFQDKTQLIKIIFTLLQLYVPKLY